MTRDKFPWVLFTESWWLLSLHCEIASTSTCLNEEHESRDLLFSIFFSLHAVYSIMWLYSDVTQHFLAYIFLIVNNDQTALLLLVVVEVLIIIFDGSSSSISFKDRFKFPEITGSWSFVCSTWTNVQVNMVNTWTSQIWINLGTVASCTLSCLHTVS